jgi:hypothetical protein
MTNKEFLDKVVEMYKAARNATAHYNEPERIKRGRNHNVSSVVEDLLAYFILKNTDAKDFELLIDYPISYKSPVKKTKKGNPAAKTIYPDVAVAHKLTNNEYIIRDIIDLKMDLGWKRNIEPTVNNAVNAIREIRQVGEGKYRKLDSDGRKTRESLNVRFDEKIKWHIVVINDQNIGFDQMNANITYATKPDFDDFLGFYIFSKDVHPNGGTPNIDEQQMNLFLRQLSLNQ